MVYPIIPRVPWYRIEGAFGSEDCRESLLREEAGVFELAYRFSKSIEGLAVPDALREAFVAIVGHEPDAAARRHYESLVTTKGPYRLVEELLLNPEQTPRPTAPPEARTRELLARFSLRAGTETTAGESFPGERKVAQRLLDSLRQASTDTFVYEGFKGVLGRNVDAESTTYYSRRIEGREMNRPLFLRELLWSEELRRE